MVAVAGGRKPGKRILVTAEQGQFRCTCGMLYTPGAGRWVRAPQGMRPEQHWGPPQAVTLPPQAKCPPTFISMLASTVRHG